MKNFFCDEAGGVPYMPQDKKNYPLSDARALEASDDDIKRNFFEEIRDTYAG